MDYKKLYEEQLKENEELKEELEGWKSARDDDIREAIGSMKEENDELKEENEKLKAQCECDGDGYAISDWFNEKMNKHIECHLGGDGEWGSLGFKNLQEFVDAYDKLEEKATAWNIINNGADWQDLRELCDKEMAKGLIKTGECDEEDFEDYDFGGESDEESDDESDDESNEELKMELEKERQFKIFKKQWIEFNEGVNNKFTLKEIEYGFNKWWEKNKSKFTSDEE